MSDMKIQPALRLADRDSAPRRFAPIRTSPTRTRRRSGFTLIELLIVVVIIGILAAIAIPKFQVTKGKAFYAGMRADLRNLATAEEAYFYDHANYSNVLDSLKLTASNGNILTITENTATGWSATSQNPQSYPHLCALFLGTAVAVAPATAEGVVGCN
ncbi:MAG TPA: prepilin-type N-terminal cleavage/methylation domain-containing protein [Gemmatimonadaceae bacterium]|jgi:prepilin-type N-terminal cleavage/methylation domain-containing protein